MYSCDKLTNRCICSWRFLQNVAHRSQKIAQFLTHWLLLNINMSKLVCAIIDLELQRNRKNITACIGPSKHLPYHGTAPRQWWWFVYESVLFSDYTQEEHNIQCRTYLSKWQMIMFPISSSFTPFGVVSFTRIVDMILPVQQKTEDDI